MLLPRTMEERWFRWTGSRCLSCGLLCQAHIVECHEARLEKVQWYMMVYDGMCSDVDLFLNVYVCFCSNA